MLPDWNKKRSFEGESFDMTPVIDVVFLLIIFFMLVCQFIAAEQFKVKVPDQIASAQADEGEPRRPLTITVMTEDGDAVCAIGSERLGDVQGDDMAKLIAAAVDESLAESNTPDKTVRLRCDKAVTFGQVKHILTGISNSQAATLDWAVIAE